MENISVSLCIEWNIRSVEKDNGDDDGFASKRKSHNETKSETKFFQYNMSHKDRGIFVIFNHKVNMRMRSS